ncbi:uncharacterized protein UHO2_05327 [Ustilago hordei]|uniref:Uncharacterized protein n=1 Tax=Ustilago hordei TaxID=120017 RepID=I2FN20_USTHO|nr:uncharacterized protein UHO2_05327 [Ustilago hordei]UTT90780.1 hypothetical protein NDA17_004680 [Ustilago hordei]CCF48313.1 uncharacterized protein UHOR_13115 [Ustilago hordei]SYW86703.1 uncharacterized protein UHO2_05327 [Ustilago hordei]
MSLLGWLSLATPLLSRSLMFLRPMLQLPPLAMWLNCSSPMPKFMMSGFDRSLTMMTPLPWLILMYTLPSSPLQQETKEALIPFGFMPFPVTYGSSPTTASSAMSDIYNGAHLARAK